MSSIVSNFGTFNREDWLGLKGNGRLGLLRSLAVGEFRLVEDLKISEGALVLVVEGCVGIEEFEYLCLESLGEVPIFRFGFMVLLFWYRVGGVGGISLGRFGWV